MSMIHKFSMDGYNIVLDVNGGGVHVLDDVAYDLVDLFEEKSMEEIVDALNKDYTREQIDEAYDEIKTLKEVGKDHGNISTEQTRQCIHKILRQIRTFNNISKGRCYNLKLYY